MRNCRASLSKQRTLAQTIGLALMISQWACAAYAGMGPCARDEEDFLTCGRGDGAARVIVKTISPSKRLAFAWRLANRPPNNIPEANDPDLQNAILRLADGVILARSRGAYWDLSTKIAPAYLFTAWSPDSHLLLKIEQRDNYANAELFFFAGDDTALGPLDLVKVIRPPMLEKVEDDQSLSQDLTRYGLIFPAYPKPTIDENGLIHLVANTVAFDGASGPLCDVTLQAVHDSHSLSAEIVSILPHEGVSISITVH